MGFLPFSKGGLNIVSPAGSDMAKKVFYLFVFRVLVGSATYGCKNFWLNKAICRLGAYLRGRLGTLGGSVPIVRGQVLGSLRGGRRLWAF